MVLSANFNIIADRFLFLKSKLRLHLILAVSTFLALGACSIFKLPKDLGYGVLNYDDLEVVRDGLPTYLLLVDGALITYPKSRNLLLTAASLNSAYSGVFIEDEERKLKMTEKAFEFSLRAICLYEEQTCQIKSMPFKDFEALVLSFDRKKDLPYLYSLASNWTGYIQLTTDDYNSIAQLARVEFIMKRVVELDESYESGMALVYLGAINSIVPPSLGGKPEVAKKYFEDAIAVSEGKNLIAKVIYAEKYARLVFNEELHNRLLNEVIASPSEVQGLTLQNEYAKQEAKRLLADGEDYF